MTKLHLAKPEHEVAYQDLCKLVSKHADKLTSLELLAVAANMLGKLVAMQDQRSVTPAMAMEIVAKNVEHGNQTVLDRLANGPIGGSA
jgi:hypothetical protein